MCAGLIVFVVYIVRNMCVYVYAHSHSSLLLCLTRLSLYNNFFWWHFISFTHNFTSLPHRMFTFVALSLFCSSPPPSSLSPAPANSRFAKINSYHYIVCLAWFSSSFASFQICVCFFYFNWNSSQFSNCGGAFIYLSVCCIHFIRRPLLFPSHSISALCLPCSTHKHTHQPVVQIKRYARWLSSLSTEISLSLSLSLSLLLLLFQFAPGFVLAANLRIKSRI